MTLTICLKLFIVASYNSSWPLLLPVRSGKFMILTTMLVQPVKCWVRWPAPVSGLYCSQAKPVSLQDSYTVSTRFLRSSVYMVVARFCCGPGCWAMSCCNSISIRYLQTVTIETYKQVLDNQVVQRHPDGATPVVLSGTIVLILLAQASD